MKLSQLDKANKLYSRIKELDAEIIEIERFADAIASKKAKIKFSLSYADLEKVAEQDKVVLDDNGFLVKGGKKEYTSMFSFWMQNPLGNRSCEKPEKTYDGKIKYELDDSLALQVLGVLLKDKMEVREKAMKAINKLGVKI